MPIKRRYQVKGTSDFLVIACIFFFLCIWSIRDAWYPTASVLKRHPRQVAPSFAMAGSVAKIAVAEGEQIAESQVLAELRTASWESDFETAKKTYTEAKSRYAMLSSALDKSTAAASGTGEGADQAKTAMDAALKKVEEIKAKLDNAVLRAPTKGMVKRIDIAQNSVVEAGQPTMVIDPMDHFYVFNKSIAVVSFVAFWVFLAIHILAR